MDNVTEERRHLFTWIRIKEFLQKHTDRPWASDHFVKLERTIGRVQIRFSWRRSNGWMGRFGGGWNWMLGFRAGANTLIFHLLVADLAFSLLKPNPKLDS